MRLEAGVERGQPDGLPGHQHERGRVEQVVAHDDDHIAWRPGRAGSVDGHRRRRGRRPLGADEHQHDRHGEEAGDDHERRGRRAARRGRGVGPGT